MWLSIGMILAWGGSPAWALTITADDCVLQADNTLRFDCTITTDVASDVLVAFGKDTGGGCQYQRSTPSSLNSTTHTVTVYGMKPSSTYDWRVRAMPAGGGAIVYGACQQRATGALPSGVGSSELANLNITTTGAPDQVDNFLTHYGCATTVDYEARDAFLIVDGDGDIVWYQEPLASLTWTDTTKPPILEAISLVRPSKHIVGIVNHEIIVEYDLAGNLLHLLCRNNGSGDCPGTSDSPDLPFTNYVHHDVQIVNDHLYTLTAEELLVPDVDDCDNDNNTTETTPIILDGVYRFDLSGPSLDVEWDWTDAPSVTLDYTVADGQGTGCDSGYWGQAGLLDGTDHFHTNAIWIDLADEWLLSIHNENDVWTVDRDVNSGTYNDVISEIDGNGVGGSWTFVGSTYTSEFYGQHTPHWGPLGDLVVFDNQFPSGPTRGVLYSMDTGTMEMEAIEEYTMEDLTAGTIYCAFGGSAWMTLGGNAFLTCPQVDGVSQAMFNEFDASNSVAWAVQFECDPGNPGYIPMGSAFRGYTNVW